MKVKQEKLFSAAEDPAIARAADSLIESRDELAEIKKKIEKQTEAIIVEMRKALKFTVYHRGRTIILETTAPKEKIKIKEKVDKRDPLIDPAEDMERMKRRLEGEKKEFQKRAKKGLEA